MGDVNYTDPSFSARSAISVTSPLAYNDDEWHHVVLSASDARVRLYVDGEEVGSANVGLADGQIEYLSFAANCASETSKPVC